MTSYQPTSGATANRIRAAARRLSRARAGSTQDENKRAEQYVKNSIALGDE